MQPAHEYYENEIRHHRHMTQHWLTEKWFIEQLHDEPNHPRRETRDVCLFVGAVFAITALIFFVASAHLYISYDTLNPMVAQEFARNAWLGLFSSCIALLIFGNQ
jgi:hypothetical protein